MIIIRKHLRSLLHNVGGGLGFCLPVQFPTGSAGAARQGLTMMRHFLFCTGMLLATMATNTLADKYDDAVIAARNAPPQEEPKEPETPSYQDTLNYVTPRMMYPFKELSHCHFQYQEADGGLLTINEFNAGDLSARISDDNQVFECRRASDCILQDYRGATHKSLSKRMGDFSPIYLKENARAEWNVFADYFNHLIVLCGGTREM